MCKNKHIEFLRNKDYNNDINYFIGENGLWKNLKFMEKLHDGEIIIGKYIDNGIKSNIIGVAHIIKINGVISPESSIEVFR